MSGFADTGKAEVDGGLAIRGVTKPVTQKGNLAVGQNLAGAEVVGLLEAKIDRRECGLNWQAQLPSGGDVTGLEVGAFALDHQPPAATAAVVLVYDAVALSIPALPDTVAFAQLRRTLRRKEQPAAMCAPLAEPIDPAQAPALAG